MSNKEFLFTRVRYDTKQALVSMREHSGYSYGELIDKMVFNWRAKDSTTAAILTLDDMVTHCSNLTDEQFNDACLFILDMIKRCFTDKDSAEIKGKVKYLEEIIRQHKVFS